MNKWKVVGRTRVCKRREFRIDVTWSEREAEASTLAHTDVSVYDEVRCIHTHSHTPHIHSPSIGDKNSGSLWAKRLNDSLWVTSLTLNLKHCLKQPLWLLTQRFHPHVKKQSENNLDTRPELSNQRRAKSPSVVCAIECAISRSRPLDLRDMEIIINT